MNSVLDRKITRHTYVPLQEDQVWLPGQVCQCGQEQHALHKGTRCTVALNANGKPAYFCIHCGDENQGTPAHPENGRAAVPLLVNGHLGSNPFLNPPGQPVLKPLEGSSTDLDTNHTDLGNAQALIDLHGDRFRYVPPRNGFLVYDGFRWDHDHTAAMNRYATHTAQSMARGVAHVNGNQLAAWSKWAVQSHNNARLKGMIEATKGHAQVTAVPDEFDRDPYIFNTHNGAYNLVTGALESHDPQHMVTKLAPVEPTDDDTPLFDAFMDWFTKQNQELQHWLLKFMGYCLTGSTQEQIFLVLTGNGANGKGVFTQILAWVLGDYLVNVDFDLFMRAPYKNTQLGLTALPGARVALASEGNEGAAWDEALIKQVTGGDRLVACAKYQDPYEYTPQCKIIFSTNDKPVLRNGSDQSMWRRLRLIQCQNHVAEEDRNPRLAQEIIEAEGHAIAGKLIRYTQIWMQEGLLPLPEAMKEALEDYRLENDLLHDFVEDQCVLEDSLTESAGELKRHYNYWAEEHGRKPINDHQLRKRLASFRGGILSPGKNAKKQTVWHGIAVKVNLSSVHLADLETRQNTPHSGP